MKIAILISGYLRTIQYNFKHNCTLFSKYDCDYYLHISKNEHLDEYCSPEYNTKEIIDMINPVSCLIEDEIIYADNTMINMRRMWYKVYALYQLVKIHEKSNQNKYDIVIRLRPDLYIIDNSLDLSKYTYDNNTIFGNTDEFNFGNTKAMNQYCNLYLSFDQLLQTLMKTNQEFKKSDFLQEYCRSIDLDICDNKIKHKLVLTLCNIIAISGDSGSGKTTLMNELESLFNRTVLKLEGDRYHKWERGNPNWKNYTHLNPDANHITKFSDDIYNLKIGENIYQVDYDHTNGTFTEIEELKASKNIIMCGLHTLYNRNTNHLFNLKIFLKPDEKLRKYWKIKRDIKNRGYNKDKVIETLRSRSDDSVKFIHPQENAADLIITFYTDEEFDAYNIDIEPNIYLKLIVSNKYNMIPMLELLDDIDYIYSKNNNHIFSFKQLDSKYNTAFYKIITTMHNNGEIKIGESSYYTIIKVFLLYMNNINM